MSDEALNKHLDWLDECQKADAAVNDEYVWQCPYCGEFVPNGDCCTCKPEEDDIPF